MPSGSVILWAGAAADVPSGWALCNGENGTPDLRGRFILGAGAGYGAGESGGAAQHAHDITINSTTLTVNQMPKHTHTLKGRGYSDRGYGKTSMDSGNRGTEMTDVTEAAGGGAPHTHSGSSGQAANLPPITFWPIS